MPYAEAVAKPIPRPPPQAAPKANRPGKPRTSRRPMSAPRALVSEPPQEIAEESEKCRDLDSSLNADTLCKRLVPQAETEETSNGLSSPVKSPTSLKMTRSRSLEAVGAGPCILASKEPLEVPDTGQVDFVRATPETVNQIENTQDPLCIETPLSDRIETPRSDERPRSESACSSNGSRAAAKKRGESPREWAARLAQKKKQSLRTRSPSPCPTPKKV